MNFIFNNYQILPVDPLNSPETTPLSSTGRGIRCGSRLSWSLGVPRCSACCGRACWCCCAALACTAPPWSGSRASRRSCCRDSTLPPPTCQHNSLFEKISTSHGNYVVILYSRVSLHYHLLVDIWRQSYHYHSTCRS